LTVEAKLVVHLNLSLLWREEGIIPLDRFVNEVIETLKVMWGVEFVFDTSFRPSK